MERRDILKELYEGKLTSDEVEKAFDEILDTKQAGYVYQGVDRA